MLGVVGIEDRIAPLDPQIKEELDEAYRRVGKCVEDHNGNLTCTSEL